MQSKILPDKIAQTFKQDFGYPEQLLFSQVTTLAQQPTLRTMRLYGIEEELGLIFLTRDTSVKWQNLRQNPQMAVCFLHPQLRLQLNANCHALLYHYDDAADLFEKYWSMVKTDVKKVYHHDYQTIGEYQDQSFLNIPQEIPKHFAMIVAIPDFWEYLWIADEYLKSIRYQFLKNNQLKWDLKRINVG